MTEQNIHNKDSDKIALLKKEIEDLKKQLALKNQIFEISPNYLLLLGLKGEILKVNNSVRNVFFDGKTDDIPPQFSQLKIIPSEDFHKYTDSVNSILNGLPSKPFKSKFLFANNEPGDGFRYIKVYISPVKSHKKITAISIFANDITDDGSLENSLEKATLISADRTLVDDNPENTTTDLISTKDTGESENYYKTIFENSTTATILVEEDNIISLVNSETENIFGYKPEEIMGQKTWLEFVTPDYRTQMIEYQKLRQDNKEIVPDQYEFCLVDKNGEFKDISAKICLIPGTKKTLASIMDVTEEKKALNKILESETMYRTLAEAMEEFVFIFDREDRLEYINKYAAEKLDVKPSQVLGKQRKDLVTKKTYQLQRKDFERIFEKGDSFRQEDMFYHKNKPLWLDSLFIPLKNGEETVEKVLLVARDINERKNHEILIKRQNKILKCMGTILTQAISSESEDEFNKTSLSMCEDITQSEFGFICEINPDDEFDTLAINESILGEYHENLDIVPMLEKLKIHESWKQLKQTKKPFILNQPLGLDQSSMPEGHPFIENLMLVPLLRDGELMGMIGLGNKGSDYESSDAKAITTISTTIVETIMRKRAEKKLQRALKDKEMLVREIHHRTKNNLMIMVSLLNLTSSDIKDEKAREIFNQIQTRTKSMALIHEKLYRSDNSKQINFGDYIRNLAQDLFNSFLKDPERVQLSMELEDLNLDIDTAIPLGLILNELLTNSMKYAFPQEKYGNIFIKFYKDGNDYVIVVNDDGVGLPADLDINKTDTLGLQLVKNLINQIDGVMIVDSEEGTHITIRFQEENYVS